jgi:hypothetical protein
MDAPVLAQYVTATGSVVGARTRLKAVHMLGGATAGTFQFRDGGAGGVILTELPMPASAVGTMFVQLPGDGVLFSTNIYATFTGGVVAATIFYG